MKSKTYLITGIDADTRNDFKAACAHFGISMKDTLIKHMQNIVKDYKYDMSIFVNPKIYKKVKGKK